MPLAGACIIMHADTKQASKYYCLIVVCYALLPYCAGKEFALSAHRTYKHRKHFATSAIWATVHSVFKQLACIDHALCRCCYHAYASSGPTSALMAGKNTLSSQSVMAAFKSGLSLGPAGPPPSAWVACCIACPAGVAASSCTPPI